jgi:hypothetical protein
VPGGRAGARDADRDAYLLLLLQRARRGAALEAVFPLPEGTPAGKPFTLAVDGRPIATGSAQANAPDLRLPLDLTAVARLRNGARVSLAGTRLSASLQGLAAALLAMDERQARAAPPLPTIVQPAVPRALRPPADQGPARGPI